MEKEDATATNNEMLARLRSRKEFLKMMGAVGIVTAVGQNVLPGQAFARTRTVSASSLDPTKLTFKTVKQYRPFGLISDNFVEVSDGFDTDTMKNYTILSPAPEHQSGKASVGGGTLSVKSNGNAKFFALFRTSKITLAPYAAVIVDVNSFIGSATNEDNVFAGLVKDDSNYVGAWYNNATKKVHIEAVVRGTVNTLVEADATLAAPVRFAFVLNSKEVTALADTGSGWVPQANFPYPVDGGPDPAITPGLSQYVDLRDPAVLAQYRYGFGVRGDSGTIVLDGVKAGYWGRAGVRDPHVVTYADGTPYIKDNKLYLTLTNAGLDFFATAHWGVYTLDLSNYTSLDALQEVGKLFFKRDGKVLGDHAGHIVYDNAAGNFLIGVSTWGDFAYNGVHVNYARESGDILHGVNLLEAQPLPLPTPYSSWDPHFALVDGQWYVAFVESPTQGNPWQHYPCLSKGSSIENLTLVARKGVPFNLNEGLKQSEGMIMQKVGGKWYVLCSTGRGDNTYEGVTPPAYRIYDLNMTLVGMLNAPYPTNIPHPMITPLPQNGNTKWIMVTFDGTMFYENLLQYGTHGDFYVMDGTPIESGYEFPPR